MTAMDQIIVLLLVLAIILLLWLAWREFANSKNSALLNQLEDKHRAMLLDLNDGLNKLGDRMNIASQGSADLLKNAVTSELNATRDAMHGLKLTQTESLAKSREELFEQLNQTFESLNKTVEGRLDLISGKVTERLDEGFKKTNETFANVMARLATIDEAQKKIDGLTVNMVSLQDLLGDKKSRGAYGEVQLEGLVRNALPPDSFKMQHTFSNDTRVDCALFLPEPTGTVAVDSKFPLENYHKMFDNTLSEAAQKLAEKQFKLDIKKHVDDISSKYIIPNVTSDGAVMFIPAEAVFAEIHAYHPDIIDYAMAKRVWVVSPTTLMAVLNTARAVLKDVEMRKQVHIIKDELGKLAKDFERFDSRMKKLADNIRQAHENTQQLHISSQKISRRFAQIERAEVGAPETDLLDDIIDDKED
jgi:DNA recombination protein RmuC